MTDWRHQMIWHCLSVPVQAKVEHAEAALRALAALSGQPLVVLEASGRGGVVSWRVGTTKPDSPRVLAALSAHLIGLRSDKLEATPAGFERADAAVSVRFLGAGRLPLRGELTPSVVRGLLDALTAPVRSESVHVQLVLGPREQPSFTRDVERPERRAVTTKRLEYRFKCSVRIAARTADDARAHSLINGVASALRLLEAPGVRLRIVRASISDFSHGRRPWFWNNTLSAADLAPLTGWPIGEHPLPGVPPAHPASLPVPPVVFQRGRVLGYGLGGEEPRPVALSEADSLRHLHLLGPTGVGKSTVMVNLAVQDMAAGYGMAVIDPKGDLIEDLLARVPESRRDDVVVLDPQDEAPIGLNGLSGDPDLAADTLLAIFHQLYADSWGVRTHDVLHASLLTLARRGDASLALIPTLLTNAGFRRSVVGRQVRLDPMGLGSFWGWFDSLSEAECHLATAPLLNKLRPILLRPGIRGVLGQRQPRFQMRDIFDKRRILLVSLSKGRLGPEAAQLLGSIVVGMVWNAALSRAARTPAGNRRPVMMHIDEVQDYLRLPGDLGDALAQGRGLGLGLTLAHQALPQLTPSIREAVMANARSRVAFGLSPRDARDLAGTTRGQLTADDFMSLPAFSAYATLLTRGTPSDWMSLTTRPTPPVTSDPAAIRARSRASYGRPLAEVEADLLGIADAPAAPGDDLGRARREDRR
jgi:hypothetical protein